MQLARSAWTRTRDVLGDNHLRSLQAKGHYATFHTDVAEAHELFASVCGAYRRFHAPLVDVEVDCELVRGFLASEVGALEDAEGAYQWIIDVTMSSSSAGQIAQGKLAAGELTLLRHQFDRAVPAFQTVIEARGHSEDWWVRQQALQAELGLGIVAMERGDTHDALQHLDVAATGYAEIVSTYPAIMYLRRLDRARSLAASLRP
jgi:tetratricopeptide (TPR) repeat protein